MAGPGKKTQRDRRKKKGEPNQVETIDNILAPADGTKSENESFESSVLSGEPESEKSDKSTEDDGQQKSREESQNPVPEYLAFTIGKEEYAIEILSIKEIVRPMSITWVPRVSTNILGVISLRGTVLPIFDLKRKLGLADGTMGRQARIIVVSLGEILMGVFVDSVTDVIRVRPSQIESLPATIGENDAEFIKGVARIKERLVILLNADKVLLPEVTADVES